MKTSAHATSNLKAIEEINSRDEQQATLYYPLDGDWAYRINGYADMVTEVLTAS